MFRNGKKRKSKRSSRRSKGNGTVGQASRGTRVNSRGDVAGPCRPSFTIETLEPRILLSATWVDADTGDPLAGATEGNDVFTGDDANDVVDALGGDDILSGGKGADTLFGGAGDDTLSGDEDNDVLFGGAGNDTLDGGDGTDTADYSGATADVTVDLAAGTATGDGSDTLTNIENVTGSDKDDTLTGDAADNVLDGGKGQDTLSGGAGNDQLFGGQGNDVLISGGGNDFMDGGIGNDTFQFTGVQNGDVITVVGDLGGQDTIDLAEYSDSQITDDGSTISVDMGGGQSFTINYTEVNKIITADGDYTPGDLGGGGNQAPDAVDDAVTTNEDTAVITGNVLAGDTDPEGDTLSITGFTQGANGTVVSNGDGTFTYTPNANFNGTDSFTYTVDDGNGGTDTATVNVTVGEVNDAPTAEAGADQTVDEGDSVTLDASGSSDLEGQSMTYTWTQTGGPAVTLSDANTSRPTFTTPAGAGNSTLTFQVEVSDGTNTSTDTMTVTVRPMSQWAPAAPPAAPPPADVAPAPDSGTDVSPDLVDVDSEDPVDVDSDLSAPSPDPQPIPDSAPEPGDILDPPVDDGGTGGSATSEPPPVAIPGDPEPGGAASDSPVTGVPPVTAPDVGDVTEIPQQSASDSLETPAATVTDHRDEADAAPESASGGSSPDLTVLALERFEVDATAPADAVPDTRADADEDSSEDSRSGPAAGTEGSPADVDLFAAIAGPDDASGLPQSSDGEGSADYGSEFTGADINVIGGEILKVPRELSARGFRQVFQEAQPEPAGDIDTAATVEDPLLEVAPRRGAAAPEPEKALADGPGTTDAEQQSGVAPDPAVETSRQAGWFALLWGLVRGTGGSTRPADGDSPPGGRGNRSRRG